MATGKLPPPVGSQVLQLQRGFVLTVGILILLVLLLSLHTGLVVTPKSRPRSLAETATHYGHHPEDIPTIDSRVDSTVYVPTKSTHKPRVWHSRRGKPGTNTHHRKVTPKSHPGAMPTSSQPPKLPPWSEEAQSESKAQSNQFGYILSLRYSGQQSAGIHAIVSQQCWMGSFHLPMLLVEPFIKNSFVVAHLENSTSALKFDDFFDMNLYSRASVAEGYGQLASWEEFLERAPRKVILIAVKYQTERSEGAKVLWERSGGSDECHKSGKTDYWNKQKKIRLLENYSFCIVKVVSCSHRFGSRHIFTADEMETVVFGSWKQRTVTLVFTLWRGPWLIPNPQLPNPEMCRRSSELTDHLTTSPRLTEAAQVYEKLFLKPKNLVAVMLRIEQFIDAIPQRNRDKKSISLEYNNCLQEVLSTVDNLKASHGPGAVFATSDVGKYGSNTWNMPLHTIILEKIGKEHVIQAAKETVSKLYENRLTFEEWENTFTNVTNGVDDRGYIAALQKALASRADCLVLVGGGSFLKLALREYLYNHPKKSTRCVKVLCAKTSYTKELMLEITSAVSAV